MQAHSDEGHGAWLMLAAGEDREHRGNDGYDDAPSSHYSWDSTVPNHQLPRPGDVIVLWDKNYLLGASVIERIEEGEDSKAFYRCPYCRMAGIELRKTKVPRYRCHKCDRTFDDAVTTRDTVTTFRSHHEIAWVDLAGQLNGRQLRQLCEHPKSQLSIRQLDYPRFRAAVKALPDHPRLSPVETSLSRMLDGGHRRALVRVRLGQGSFRSRLLNIYGDACAFTGPAPRDALEAAHLYSFAADGRHHDEGGLLLRRDVHRLFDLGYLAVHPADSRIDVAPPVAGYAEYARLHGGKLQVDLTRRQVDWIAQHWRMHRLVGA